MEKEVNMKITNYKELKEYLKGTNATVSAQSDEAKVVYVDGNKVVLPMDVNDGKNN